VETADIAENLGDVARPNASRHPQLCGFSLPRHGFSPEKFRRSKNPALALQPSFLHLLQADLTRQSSIRDLKALLTFTGFHDPYAPSAATGEMRAGPILTVLAERSFDRVCLFSTPKAAEISEKTAAAIIERHPGVKVEILEVPLKDPTNYLGILRQLRSHFKKLNVSHPAAEYSISVSHRS
jgi:xanthine/CO dehydrogenase XdhC/CoxF family maturation factor